MYHNSKCAEIFPRFSMLGIESDACHKFYFLDFILLLVITSTLNTSISFLEATSIVRCFGVQISLCKQP